MLLVYCKPINVTSSSMPPIEEYIEEIKSLWESRWLTNAGQKHQELTKRLCDYLDAKNVVLFTNGHLALESILQSMNLSGEVITTPFTFSSTTQAIVRSGLVPVFCDISASNYTIDVTKIENLITEKTTAILPVHVYGNLCDYQNIKRIANKYGLKVIYDAAHAFGMKVNGKGIGELGDASMFSFHATKVFHTIEGGCVCCNGDNLSSLLTAWRQFGMQGKEDAEILGVNAKMTEFQAAMGLCNLKHISGEIEKRKAVSNRYRENLSGKRGIILCREDSNVQYNYAYFPVLFDSAVLGYERDKVSDELGKNNIYTRKYFYPLTSSFSAYKNLFPVNPTPIAERVSSQILTLPLYADLSLKDVDRICQILLKCV